MSPSLTGNPAREFFNVSLIVPGLRLHRFKRPIARRFGLYFLPMRL
jgi:hypothetical protein